MGRAKISLALLCLALPACQGGIGDAAHAGSAGGGPGQSGTAGTGATSPGVAGSASGAGASAGMGGTGSGGGAGGPGGAAAAGLLPARIRRLTNAEFDTSVKALLGVDSTFGQNFTPDSRQDGFTRNDAQRVDPVFMTQLTDAAETLAATAVGTVTTLAPCSDPAGSEACARTFLTGFAARAYRRPATSAEIDALVTVYHAGADGATYPEGIQATVQAVLESPGFLYLTELGDTPLATSVTLDQYEIATSLAYLATGSPPDDALLADAKAGKLLDASTRQSELVRLLGTQAASAQITRLIEEWLGIDSITATAKDSNAYPDFAGLRDSMKKEADAFSAEVMWKSAGSVSDLLSADWTIADDDSLARMYLNLGTNDAVPRTGNHVSLTNVRRRGIVNQGAFLSVYAHANETAPVLRGVAVLRRVACDDIPDPTTQKINVVPPAPDPSKTTRQRFDIHASPTCASCHERIDSVGFTFEDLDGMGRFRQTDNGQPVDSTSTIASNYDFDGNYADSAALALGLAASSDVRACFARHLFRSAATTSGDLVKDAESAFMTAASALPDTSQGKVREILTAFVTSDAFVTRKAGQ